MRLGGGRGIGLGGLVILLALSLIFKRDFLSLAAGGGQAVAPDAATAPPSPVDDPTEEPMVQFVSFVLDDAQSTWTTLLAGTNTPYRDARLVLFRNAIQSACGFAQSATGPFYCPGDEKVYIDLAFFEELQSRFGAPGDFAQAYVLAHEIGHHVQNVLGIEQQVRRAQRSNPGAQNDLSVRMELQADCFAGIWANSTARRDLLQEGDIDEGLAAAAAVGDDRIQQSAGGMVNPESFTHGSSAQRASWFRRGFQGGRLDACDTFRG
jgi:predicted metalloprotease